MYTHPLAITNITHAQPLTHTVHISHMHTSVQTTLITHLCTYRNTPMHNHKFTHTHTHLHSPLIYHTPQHSHPYKLTRTHLHTLIVIHTLRHAHHINSHTYTITYSHQHYHTHKLTPTHSYTFSHTHTEPTLKLTSSTILSCTKKTQGRLMGKGAFLQQSWKSGVLQARKKECVTSGCWSTGDTGALLRRALTSVLPGSAVCMWVPARPVTTAV
jgi:hypothetical protein